MSYARIVPAAVIGEIAGAMPPECRQHVVIIGSLAAGWHFSRGGEQQPVQTKDVDCLLAPRSVAVEQAATLTNALLAHGWIPEYMERAAGTADTPIEKLPVVRLRPRLGHHWFIELLTSTDEARAYLPVTTTVGRWVLAAFPHLALTAHRASEAFGIRIARPEMMALANLLNHPRLTDTRMSSDFEGRYLRRCSKDLGRVLALAYLELRLTQDIDAWSGAWIDGLRQVHPTHAADLARRCGSGLRALLASSDHMDEAVHSCAHGLLTTHAARIDVDTLRVAGRRIVEDVIVPVEQWSA